jgi:hypothetical protein
VLTLVSGGLACGQVEHSESPMQPSDGGNISVDAASEPHPQDAVSEPQPKDAAVETSIAACASVRSEREPPGLAVAFIIEASNSMAEPAPGATQSRFELIREALEAAVVERNRGVALELITFPADRQCSTTGPDAPLAMLTAEHKTRVIEVSRGLAPAAGAEPAHEAFRVAREHLNPSASGFRSARRAVVLVMDDAPAAEQSCGSDAGGVPSLISEIVRASDEGIVPGAVIVGLEANAGAQASLERLSAGGMYVDCGFSSPDACELPDSTGRGTLSAALKEVFDVLTRQIRAVSTSCTLELPMPQGPAALDLSHLELVITSEDEPSQVFAYSRDDSCRDGFRIEPDQQSFTLCGSACAHVQEYAGALFGSFEVRFNCLAE